MPIFTYANEDLYDVIQSLIAKSEDKEPNLEAEITALEKALKKQESHLKDVVEKQISDLQRFTEKIRALIK